MTIEFDHTVLAKRNRQRATTLLAGILGLQTNSPFTRFLPPRLGNHVASDYLDGDEPLPRHRAFVVGDDTSGSTLARTFAAGIVDRAEPDWDGPVESCRKGRAGTSMPLPSTATRKVHTPPGASVA
jgi:hypothetical protein